MKIRFPFKRRNAVPADQDAWLAQLHEDAPIDTEEHFSEPEDHFSYPEGLPAPLVRPYVEQSGRPIESHRRQHREHESRDKPGNAGIWQERQPAPGRQPPEVDHDEFPRPSHGDPSELPAPPAAAAPAAPASLPDRLPGRLRPAGRALIGDQLRRPAVWCQMGSCVERYAAPSALGEVDNRCRAIAAGWREDALGRMACPACVQRDPQFRVTYPTVPSRPARR